MAAPYGNKNAEKWDIKKAKQLFRDAIKLCDKKEVITIISKDKKSKQEIDGYRFDFIGEIARELGTFKDIFSHLENRFPEELKGLKSELYTKIESNCYWNGKRGIIKEASSIMNLKSNWKWTDRQDHTSDGDKINININGI